VVVPLVALMAVAGDCGGPVGDEQGGGGGQLWKGEEERCENVTCFASP